MNTALSASPRKIDKLSYLIWFLTPVPIDDIFDSCPPPGRRLAPVRSRNEMTGKSINSQNLLIAVTAGWSNASWNPINIESKSDNAKFGEDSDPSITRALARRLRLASEWVARRNSPALVAWARGTIQSAGT